MENIFVGFITLDENNIDCTNKDFTFEHESKQ